MWSIIGVLAVAYVSMRVLLSLWRCVYALFIANALGFNLDLQKMGKWAVITGATDGIGKEYALQLASRGLNIVLISRSDAKLQAVAKEIRELYPVETKEIVADFSRTDIYEDIRSALEGLDIGVLVNNVGMSYKYFDHLVNLPDMADFTTKMLNINIHSMIHMTLIVLPGMQERRRGIVINIASISGLMPTPYLTMYGASKAFVIKFSQDMRMECSEHGVHIQCVIPGFVISNMSKMKRINWRRPVPRDYVKQALASVGVASQTCGYIGHEFWIYLYKTLKALWPTFLVEHLFMTIMKRMRIKSIKREEKQSKMEGKCNGVHSPTLSNGVHRTQSLNSLQETPSSNGHIKYT